MDLILAFIGDDRTGWGVVGALCIAITVGGVFEIWVPGRRYRRLEVSAKQSADSLTEAMKQNGQLITGNEITKHFFEETTPKRGETS